MPMQLCYILTSRIRGMSYFSQQESCGTSLDQEKAWRQLSTLKFELWTVSPLFFLIQNGTQFLKFRCLGQRGFLCTGIVYLPIIDNKQVSVIHPKGKEALDSHSPEKQTIRSISEFNLQSIPYTSLALRVFPQVNILILSPGLVDFPALLGPLQLLLACSTISGFTTSVCHKMLQHVLSSIAILR